MEIYVVSINGKAQSDGFTGLKNLCEHYKLSYPAVSKGRLNWFEGNDFYMISSVKVNKITGRDNNFKPKKQRENEYT